MFIDIWIVSDADIGDRFYRVQHVPYTDAVKIINLSCVTEVDSDRVICQPCAGEKVWHFFRRLERPTYNLPDDLFIVNLL